MSDSLALNIERSDVFTVKWTGDNTSQCGQRGTQQLSYKVRITGSESYLTPQGFIIDNNEIHDYFVSKYRLVTDFVSCERIAAQACRDFKAMFGVKHLKGVKVTAIEVTIAGGPKAQLTASWKAMPRRPSTGVGARLRREA